MEIFEIILICFMAVLTGITTYKWKEINLLGKITLITIIVCAIVVSLNSYYQKKEDDISKKIKSKVGVIYTDGATESLLKLGYKENGQVVILPHGKFIAVDDPDNTLLNLKLVDGKLMVNVIIRDFDGTVIASIEDSAWKVYNDDFEYNNNDTALELVTKGDRDVFFQVFYKNGMIHLSGYLLDEHGRGLVIFNNDKHVNSTVLFTGTTPYPNDKMPHPSYINIKRIFKYPREIYYGIEL